MKKGKRKEAGKKRRKGGGGAVGREKTRKKRRVNKSILIPMQERNPNKYNTIR